MRTDDIKAMQSVAAVTAVSHAGSLRKTAMEAHELRGHGIVVPNAPCYEYTYIDSKDGSKKISSLEGLLDKYPFVLQNV